MPVLCSASTAIIFTPALQFGAHFWTSHTLPMCILILRFRWGLPSYLSPPSAILATLLSISFLFSDVALVKETKLNTVTFGKTIYKIHDMKAKYANFLHLKALPLEYNVSNKSQHLWKHIVLYHTYLYCTKLP